MVNTRVTAHIAARLPLLALLLGAAFATAPAWAAPPGETAAFAELNRQERTVCMKTEAGAVRDDCMLDAFGANLSRQRHTLDDVAPDYARNAIRRCDALKGDLREGCLARMRGDGTTTGTAREGGIYRELVTAQQAPSDTQKEANAPANPPVGPALAPAPMAKP
jgi:hypothetical protein